MSTTVDSLQPVLLATIDQCIVIQVSRTRLLFTIAKPVYRLIYACQIIAITSRCRITAGCRRRSNTPVLQCMSSINVQLDNLGQS